MTLYSGVLEELDVIVFHAYNLRSTRRVTTCDFLPSAYSIKISCVNICTGHINKQPSQKIKGVYQGLVDVFSAVLRSTSL